MLEEKVEIQIIWQRLLLVFIFISLVFPGVAVGAPWLPSVSEYSFYNVAKVSNVNWTPSDLAPVFPQSPPFPRLVGGNSIDLSKCYYLNPYGAPGQSGMVRMVEYGAGLGGKCYLYWPSKEPSTSGGYVGAPPQPFSELPVNNEKFSVFKVSCETDSTSDEVAMYTRLESGNWVGSWEWVIYAEMAPKSGSPNSGLVSYYLASFSGKDKWKAFYIPMRKTIDGVKYDWDGTLHIFVQLTGNFDGKGSECRVAISPLQLDQSPDNYVLMN